ncbi:MAG: hypothetical protein NT068_00290 [Candidatus Nomurabacteria bacterium]|nr:hypothetical protein [Candidatus Nomurabacteria bacterium]
MIENKKGNTFLIVLIIFIIFLISFLFIKNKYFSNSDSMTKARKIEIINNLSGNTPDPVLEKQTNAILNNLNTNNNDKPLTDAEINTITNNLNKK